MLSTPWTCGKGYLIDQDITDEVATLIQQLAMNYEKKLKTTKMYYVEKMK